MSRAEREGEHAWASVGQCQVCLSPVVYPRTRSCSRKCTVTAADRRRNHSPVDDASYYALLDARRRDHMKGPAYSLVPLHSKCEEEGCRAGATQQLVRQHRLGGPKLCTRHARKRLAALTGGASKAERYAP